VQVISFWADMTFDIPSSMTTHQDPANEKEISYKLTDELTIDMKDFS